MKLSSTATTSPTTILASSSSVHLADLIQLAILGHPLDSRHSAYQLVAAVLLVSFLTSCVNGTCCVGSHGIWNTAPDMSRPMLPASTDSLHERAEAVLLLNRIAVSQVIYEEPRTARSVRPG